MDNNIEDIFGKYADMVLRISLQNTGNLMSAEDITQEVFIKYFTGNKEFKSEEHIKAWLIRVTINLCRNYFNSSWHKKMILYSETEKIFGSMEYSEEKKEVLHEVMKLSANYRNVIYLYFYEGYNTREIADILNKKEGTISTWLRRGKQKLKMNLEGGK